MQTTETTHQMPTPTTKEGEKYAGTIINPDGSGRHIYLLPGDNDDASQQQQMKWAESIGGDLPDRVESALLFNQSADEFKKEAYWLNETHKHEAEWAWYQLFYDGHQDDYRKDLKLRARAVRREFF